MGLKLGVRTILGCALYSLKYGTLRLHAKYVATRRVGIFKYSP